MSSRLEDLRALAQMLDDGKITQREYEVVKTELLEAPAEEWANFDPPEVEAIPVEEGVPHGIPVHANGGQTHHAPDEIQDEGPEQKANSNPDWLEFAKQIPPLYWASLGAAMFSVFFAGLLPPIAWGTAAVSIVALARVRDPGMRWMAWTGVAIGVLFSMIGLFNSGTAGSVEAQPLANASTGPEELDEIPVGSLGIEFADLSEGWNALPDPPFILKGVSVSPEAGVLDSFVYRFDEAALLAGAYNPSDGYIYALMAKTGVGHESRSNMFVHLCYLLYPGTQECFDTYIGESGLYGKPDEELPEDDYTSRWVFEGNEWRVEVDNEIETIRVLGPQQTG